MLKLRCWDLQRVLFCRGGNGCRVIAGGMQALEGAERLVTVEGHVQSQVVQLASCGRVLSETAVFWIRLCAIQLFQRPLFLVKNHDQNDSA